MKKLTVSIIIPAYNEAANIGRIVADILTQRRRNFTLDRIVVLSDGSTDTTVDIVRSVRNPRVLVKKFRSRKGKVYRINTAFAETDTDVLVQLDADIRLPNENIIDELIQPFITRASVGMVCGDHEPLPPRTYTERIAQFGDTCWKIAVASLGNQAGLYRCFGHIRAMHRRMYKDFRLPLAAGSSEDTFSYYYAVQHKIAVVFAPKACVEYRLPNTLTDYMKQATRFLSERSILSTYFPLPLIRIHETMTMKAKFRAFIIAMLKTSPHIVLSYILVQSLAYLLPKKPDIGGIWEVSVSTKYT